jgi:hypothetical protein
VVYTYLSPLGLTRCIHAALSTCVHSRTYGRRGRRQQCWAAEHGDWREQVQCHRGIVLQQLLLSLLHMHFHTWNLAEGVAQQRIAACAPLLLLLQARAAAVG